MLFAEGGEDEVRVGDGKKVALGLSALGGAFPPNSTRADGDQGLADLIARALWIGIRVDEAGKARLLVGLEALSTGPGARTQHQHDGDENQSLLQADSSKEQPSNEDGSIDERCAQIWLNEDQNHRHADHCQSLEDVAPSEVAAPQIRKIARDHQDQHQLYPLRRLKLDGTNLNPPPCSKCLVSHELHGDQSYQASSVGPGSPIDQAMVVDVGEDEHNDQAGNDEEDLLRMESGESSVQGRRIDLEHGDCAERQHHAEQAPIEVAET